MREQLRERIEKRVQQCVGEVRNHENPCLKIEKKKEGLVRRAGEIVKAEATGKIISIGEEKDEIQKVAYDVHLKYLIKQGKLLYVEEELEHRLAEFYKGVFVGDEELNPFKERLQEQRSLSAQQPNENQEVVAAVTANEERGTFVYDRLKAVQYAERWWNSYNPAYEKFEVDCTNYISQCLHAGGALMTGYPNRSKGWWMQNKNWSFSWSVANSLRWYLPGAKSGLRAIEVSSPEELKLGDVICYDFQGDGRFDHNTIVTGKDSDGMPLVNAHTYNSRMRYWAYEDSSAYTPNIKYKFLTIVDDS